MQNATVYVQAILRTSHGQGDMAGHQSRYVVRGQKSDGLICCGVGPHLGASGKLLKSPTSTWGKCPDQESAGWESNCGSSWVRHLIRLRAPWGHDCNDSQALKVHIIWAIGPWTRRPSWREEDGDCTAWAVKWGWGDRLYFLGASLERKGVSLWFSLFIK